MKATRSTFKAPFLAGNSYFSPLIVTSSAQSFIYASAPVRNSQGETIGVLRVRYNGLILQQFVRQYNGLAGVHSYAVLMDENNIRLADGFTPLDLFKTVAPLPELKVQVLKDARRLPPLPNDQITTNIKEFDSILRNFKEEPYFSLDLTSTSDNQNLPELGIIYPLTQMPWKIVYIIENYDDAAVQRTQGNLTILISTIVACLTGFIALASAQVLNRPISQLMKTAESISSGDLDARAPSNSSDEFGMLGNAFNMMTSQMRSFIIELEDRVRTRTSEIESQNKVLANRARQLQTVSDVARQIVSVQEMEPLLNSVSQMIGQRFGFYHVGIFLLDENHEFAVLRASNSEGGHKMLERHHMLPVGRLGIVGYVTSTGNPRIATDVGDDATFFNNPDLPLTRSEMALPLKVGQEIIGALDIQSIDPDAFHKDDIELFNTLADQVAIAIYNNSLYTETVRALNEAQTLHRQYLRNEWEQEVSTRKVRGYLYNRLGVSVQDQELPVWQSVLTSGKPVIEEIHNPSENNKAIMAVPINVRGETIGVIHVQDQAAGRNWSEDELEVVTDVANQVAVALENARLFEATVRRAEREKKVLEITAKIRSTNEPDRMMQIAVTELQHALGASRAQIYVRKQNGTNDNGSASNGSNGHTQ